MCRKWQAVSPWLFAVLLATAASADEVIYFTNGTSLPIRSHRIEKDMISVDLGTDARMGFPVYMVDKIESAGRKVYLNPTYHPSNQAVAAGSGEAGADETAALPAPDLTVSGQGSVPSRYRNPGRRPSAGEESGLLTDVGAAPTGRGNTAAGRFRAVGNRTSAAFDPAAGKEQSTVVVRAPSRGRSGLARLSPRTAGVPTAPPAAETPETPAPEETTPDFSTEPLPTDDAPPPE